MKATGIVRKVDQLGRIVIPKELRKSLGIDLGEPLEIYTDDNKIILKKYEPQNSCIMTGNISDRNISLGQGKFVLSHEGLELLKMELEEYLEKK